MLINVIFSFRNEEKNLIELVSRVKKAFSQVGDIEYKLIFINDCSTDNSFGVLLKLKEEHPIEIITTSRRFGYIGGVLAGFDHSMGDAVIYMDSDLQDPPELIPEMISKFKDGYEVVHTRRTKREETGYIQQVITKWAYSIIRKFSEIKIPEDTGDFKLLSARATKEILNIREYDPYVRGLSVWIGFRQTSIDYIREPRFQGISNFPIFKSLAPYREFIRAIASNSVLPLYFSIYLGLVSILASIIIAIFALYTKIVGISIPGNSSILLAVSFFGGSILITNGVLGIYLGRIYNAVKGRPNFIIDNIVK